jgi:hypothetical protein
VFHPFEELASPGILFMTGVRLGWAEGLPDPSSLRLSHAENVCPQTEIRTDCKLRANNRHIWMKKGIRCDGVMGGTPSCSWRGFLGGRSIIPTINNLNEENLHTIRARKNRGGKSTPPSGARLVRAGRPAPAAPQLLRHLQQARRRGHQSRNWCDPDGQRTSAYP